MPYRLCSDYGFYFEFNFTDLLPKTNCNKTNGVKTHIILLFAKRGDLRSTKYMLILRKIHGIESNTDNGRTLFKQR